LADCIVVALVNVKGLYSVICVKSAVRVGLVMLGIR